MNSTSAELASTHAVVPVSSSMLLLGMRGLQADSRSRVSPGGLVCFTAVTIPPDVFQADERGRQGSPRSCRTVRYAQEHDPAGDSGLARAGRDLGDDLGHGRY